MSADNAPAPADEMEAQPTDSKQVRSLLEQLTSIVAEIGVLLDEEERKDGEDETAPVDDAAMATRAAKLEELSARGESIRSQIDRLRKIAAKERELRGFVSRTTAPKAAAPATATENRSMPAETSAPVAKPFAAPSRGYVKGYGYGPEAERRAYAVGQWALGFLYGREESRRWCAENGVLEQRAQSVGTASLGGNLVPTILADQTIQLIDQYGQFKPNAKNVNMPGPYYEIPKRLNGLKMYPMGEGLATTTSDKAWEKVALTAKKWAVENRLSNEVLADAVIDLASDITEEMALAFAQGIDDTGFNGTGSTSGDPNYQGIKGVIPSMLETVTVGSGQSAVQTPLAGVYQSASATSFETFSIADFTLALAKVPLYARTPNLKWYVSPVGWAAAMQRLMLTSGANPGTGLAGGNTADNLSGGTGPTFMGLPVVQCNALNATLGTDNDKVKVILADLSLGAIYGGLRDITYRTSTERLFELDTTIMQATARFDIRVHGVGTVSKPGPIIVMKTKAA